MFVSGRMTYFLLVFKCITANIIRNIYYYYYFIVDGLSFFIARILYRFGGVGYLNVKCLGFSSSI